MSIDDPLYRVVVAGGRTYDDEEAVHWLFATWLAERVPSDKAGPSTVASIVHGGAPGADALVDRFAREYGYAVEILRADWRRYGRAALPLRNLHMIETEPDAVVAFPGGVGTADLVHRAKQFGVPVWAVRGAGDVVLDDRPLHATGSTNVG